MKRVLVSVALTACAAVPIPYEVPPSQGFVHNDMGGVIWDRAQIIADMNAGGRGLEIRGAVCASACLMYLSLDNVCVSRGTTFYLHGLKNLTSISPVDPDVLAQVTDIYISHLPRGIADIWDAEVKGNPSKYYAIPARTIVRNGWGRYCNKIKEAK